MQNVSVSVAGSDYLKQHGIEELLNGLVQELAAAEPADPVEFLRSALGKIPEDKKKRKIDAGAGLEAFPGLSALKWRRLASARAKEISSGPAPGEAQVLCAEGAHFPVSPSDTALVLIDMQTDFLEPTGRVGQFYTDTPVRSGMDGCERLLNACRAAGLTIAHSRSHRYGAAVQDQLVDAGDVGYELHPRFAAKPGEIVVDKWTFGAFASTDLEKELRDRGVNRIFVAGVLTNVCVMNTAFQGVDRFFRVCIVKDASACFDDSWHDMALKLINEPQRRKGHNRQLGLYFGEVAEVAEVEKGLAPLIKK